ncbi:MAG: hypothetical protein DRJ10_18460 [Bacteroidetes bacterium]|nr:MAG: hypothetical protein DRJ10_18460 [Bacteroidota bacterium]
MNSLETISGDFNVSFNDAIESLIGLESLSSVGGKIRVTNNYELQNLQGLENITHVHESLRISNNDNLISIEELENINTIGGSLIVFVNNSLPSLEGLHNLSSVGGYLWIIGCYYLPNLDGLRSLVSVDGNLNINGNTILSNLKGLLNLTSINGHLRIGNNGSAGTNPNLTSLHGLDNIEYSTIQKLLITHNNLLTECDVKSICEYLSSPSSDADIFNNTTGCNSQYEVEEACLVFIGDETVSPQVKVYPNPFNTITTFEYTLQQPSTVQITIFNYLGKEVEVIRQQQNSGSQKVAWDASSFSTGIYYYHSQIGTKPASGKLVILR